MKINLPDRQRWLVIGAGAVVALFLLDKVLLTPLSNWWQDSTKEISRLQTAVTDGRNAIARANRTEKEWADMQANALPKNPGQAEQEIISALDRWATTNRLDAAYSGKWTQGKTDKYSLWECRIEAAGNLSALSHFLFEIERSPLALRVQSVEISSRDDTGSKLTMGLVVSGLRFAPLERPVK
jgi:hypothetical protein